jgi:hypothetical protein
MVNRLPVVERGDGGGARAGGRSFMLEGRSVGRGGEGEGEEEVGEGGSLEENPV